MFGKHDFAGDLSIVGDDNSVTKPLRPLLQVQPTKEKVDDEKKIRLGVDFLRPKDGFFSIPNKPGNSQELTLSYLCEMGEKGKEVAENSDRDETTSWVERDFLSLSESRGNSCSKREAPSEEMIPNTSAEKKSRLEKTLNLSLALPDVSFSNDFSNDFTAAASMSCSYSHPFSHNPSCSMTRNSTENYDYSQSDKIWCAGEGTNGSVHSRFRPLGDGGVSCFSMMRETRQSNNKDSTFRSLYRTTSCSDNTSFFPSELQARPQVDNLSLSGDSRRRGSEDVRVLESMDGGRMRKPSPAERLVREIVSESVPVMAQKVDELSAEMLESLKEYLRNLIEVHVKKEEFLGLQSLLERRSDLTKETLLKCHKDQLAVLVAVRMGLKSFLSENVQVSMIEMVEIFLYTRCRNVSCKNFLPIDDCDCKICSGNNGFCSSCMCPVCLQFDCAENTCSWVGCDVCSHWCHAHCGLEKNLIRPAPSLKGPSGTTDLQFHCIGCGHTSEMFGFVKDVFLYCAKNWGLETLVKELDCVKNIFSCSDDPRGKKLYLIADGLVKKLQCRSMSPSDACDIMFRLFNNIDCVADISIPGTSSKEPVTPQANLGRDELSVTPPKHTVHNTGPTPGQADLVSKDVHKKDFRSALMKDLKTGDEFPPFGRLCKSDGFDSLESMVRIKEAEARMFQSKADEARREAEGFKRMIQVKMESLEEEYSEKLRRLCLQETEEKRRKKVDELKALENSQCDYYKMKLRMQREIAGLLERMEATKQQWA